MTLPTIKTSPYRRVNDFQPSLRTVGRTPKNKFLVSGAWTKTFGSLDSIQAPWYQLVPGNKPPETSGINVRPSVIGRTYTRTGYRGNRPPYHTVTSSSLVRRSLSPALGDFRLDWKDGTKLYQMSEPVLVPIDVTSSSLATSAEEVARVDNEALMKFYHHAGSITKGANIIGQAGQTLGMFGRAVHGLAGAIESTAKSAKNGKLADKLLKQVPVTAKQRNDFYHACSDAWLEWTYGWNPLISDVKATAEAVASVVLHNSRTHFSGQSEANFKWSGRATFVVGGMAGYYQPYGLVTVERNLTIKYGATYLNTWSPGSVSREWGIDTQGLVDGLWDVLPYSFLIDYFVNAGDWLYAIAFPHEDFTNPWKVVVNSVKANYDWVASIPVSYQTSVTAPTIIGTSYDDYFLYNRQSWVLGQPPSLEFNFPGLKQVENLTNLAINKITSSRNSPVWKVPTGHGGHFGVY